MGNVSKIKIDLDIQDNANLEDITSASENLRAVIINYFNDYYKKLNFSWYPCPLRLMQVNAVKTYHELQQQQNILNPHEIK